MSMGYFLKTISRSRGIRFFQPNMDRNHTAKLRLQRLREKIDPTLKACVFFYMVCLNYHQMIGIFLGIMIINHGVYHKHIINISDGDTSLPS